MPRKHSDKLVAKFTIRVDRDGQPVQKRLCDMSGDEVLSALEWHLQIDKQMQEKAKGPNLLIEALRQYGVRGDDPPAAKVAAFEAIGTTQEALSRGVQAIEAAGGAADAAGRLMKLVLAAMPQLDQHPNMTIKEGVARFWPQGHLTG